MTDQNIESIDNLESPQGGIPQKPGKTPNALTCMIYGIVSAASSSLVIPGIIFAILAFNKRKKDHPTVLANPGMYKASEIHMKIGFGLAWLGIGLSGFFLTYFAFIIMMVSATSSSMDYYDSYGDYGTYDSYDY